MGINVWLEWDDMTPAEYKAQISTCHASRGSVGYLRGGGFGWFKDAIYRLFDFLDDYDKQYHMFGQREIKKYEENLHKIMNDRSRTALREGLISMSGYEKRQTTPIPDSEIGEYTDFIFFAKQKLREGKKLRINFSR